MNMCMTVIILNRIELLNDLLEKLNDSGIKGATILESRGMAHSLYEYDELMFFGGLHQRLNPERNESRTILIVGDEDKVSVISDVLNEVTGGIDKADVGVMFTVPVNYTEGFGNIK